MAKLKQCPFCGGDADYRTENFGDTVWVMCLECGVCTSRYDANVTVCGRNGKEWATDTWNRRTSRDNLK